METTGHAGGLASPIRPGDNISSSPKEEPEEALREKDVVLESIKSTLALNGLQISRDHPH